ncbi:hypothetical protein [Paracoccus sp. S1E-3]|uniref:hypothetical protein n=1 Tax=Paracoccus sp. S1E-3 TaxID=2756130 RepID=UPI0015EF88E7|nr:hypothetical protein [Paracoccus sp. S1E-3]MBA4491682.1 hypothetical protein [Paracoccus sp. S1E-3]
MSAPQTDPEKQARNHIVPILGMIIVVVLVVLGFLWWVGDETDDPEMPGEVTGPIEEITPSQPETTTAQPPD